MVNQGDTGKLDRRTCYARILACLGETCPKLAQAFPAPSAAEEADLDFLFGEIIFGVLLEKCGEQVDEHKVSLSEYAKRGTYAAYPRGYLDPEFLRSRNQSRLSAADL